MRITTFLLLVCVFCSHAKSTYSQDARVSIHMNNAQLNKILSEIEKQTEYLFIYNNEVNANQAVSINANQKKVADVLNDLLKDRNISFKIEGSHIILSRKNHSELKNSEAAVQQQQPFKVSGTVLDKSGLPVIGANVQVTNSAGIGTITDMDGNFTLVAAFENTAKGVGNVDYFKLHYKDAAYKQNHNLSLSGGGKLTQYYVSGGAYTEDGILRYADMDYKRFNFNASVTSQVTDWLKMKVNTKFMHSDNNTPFGTGGLSEGFYHSLARFRPTVSEVDPNGHFTELTMIPYLQSGTYTNTQDDNMSLTGGFEIQPIKNWRIFVDYTYRNDNEEYEALNVAPQIPGADNETLYKGTRSELNIAANGRFTRSMSKRRYQSVNLYTNYLFTLAEDHNFTLMGGYQEEDNNYSYLFNQVTDLISTTNSGLGLSTGDQTMFGPR